MRIYRDYLHAMERKLFDRVLRKTKGNKKEAARILQINRNTLSAKLKILKIKIKDYKI